MLVGALAGLTGRGGLTTSRAMSLSDLLVRRFARALPLVAAGFLAWAGWLGRLDGIDARHANVLKVPVRIVQAAELHLYYDVGRGLWAGDVVIRQLEGAPGWRVLALPLPREPIHGLRLDPMTAPGEFGVKAPWLESATGRVLAKFPSAAVIPRHQIADWREQEGGWWAVTRAGADDPQVTFGLGGPLRHARTRPWAWWLTAAALAAGLRVGLGRHPAVRTRRRWRDGIGQVARRGWRRVADGVATGARGWRERGGAVARWSAGWRVWIGAVVVVVAQAWLLRGIGEGIDWPMWDEANYAGRGADWADGRGQFGQLHTGPGFVLNYGVLSWWGDAGQTVIWQHYVVKLGVALMLYFALVRLWRNPLAALAATLAWSATWFQLQYPTLVYQAAWMWFLAAVAVIDRWPLVGTLLLGWTVTYRQDYQFALPVVLGWLVWIWWRAGRRVSEIWIRGGRARWSEHVLAAVAAAALLAAIGTVARGVSWGGVGQRGWFAFQQHYAVRAVATGEVSGLNPYAEYPRLIAQDFPGATSLGEAWAVNPGAMVSHVGWNLRRALVEIGRYWRAAEGLVPVLVLGGVFAVLALLRRGGWAAEPESPGSRSGAAGLLLGGLLVIGPGLVVLAKDTYLLPALALALGGVGWTVARLGRTWGDRGERLLRRLTAMGAIALGLAVLAAPRAFDHLAPHRAVAMTATALREVWPETGRHTLVGYGASTYEVYLGRERCRGVEPVNAVTGDSAPNRSVAQLLAEERPTAVLVTHDWITTAEVDEAPLRERVQEGGWQVRPVPGGRLYWRAR